MTGPFVAALAAGVASAAFAYVYQGSLRTLPTAGLAGAIGLLTQHVGRQLLDLPPAMAAAGAAVVVGLLAHVLAWRQNAPSVLFVTAGVVPLLPGLTVYSGMLQLAHGSTSAGLEALVSALVIGLALAAGALLGEYLAAPGDREARRYEQPGRGLRPSRHRRPTAPAGPGREGTVATAGGEPTAPGATEDPSPERRVAESGA